MKHSIQKIVFLGLLLTLSEALLAQATDRYEELTGERDEYDVIEKEWTESTTRIPPLPAPDAWTPIQLDTLPRGQTAYLALDSLSLNKDDFVLRYWIAIRSQQGAEQMTYEGLRCSTKQYIVYGWGYRDRDPDIRKRRQPKWLDVPVNRGGRYRFELMRDILCAGETPRNHAQIEAAAKGRFERNNPFNNWVNDD